MPVGVITVFSGQNVCQTLDYELAQKVDNYERQKIPFAHRCITTVKKNHELKGTIRSVEETSNELDKTEIGVDLKNVMKNSIKKSCFVSIRNFLSFRSLKEEEDFIDVTLSCEETQYSAHKVVLSACSPYFRKLLKVNNTTTAVPAGFKNNSFL